MDKLIIACLPILILSYSPPLALQLGYMSAAAYSSQSQIKSWNCSYCHKYKMVNITPFYNTEKGVQGFTCYSQGLKSIIVSFRGSSNIINWIYNLDTLQVGYPDCTGCYVHKGFYDSYKSVSSIVRSEVAKLKSAYKSAEIMVTGHSLGGALAVLAAVQIHKNVGVVSRVYNFGQPRVGNRNLANHFAGVIPNTFRVIDYADIVPHLPPKQFNFNHFGHEMWYHPRGMQAYTECESQDPKCADSVSPTELNADDHDIDKYLKMKVGFLRGWKLLRSKLHTLQRLNQGKIEIQK